MRPMIYIAGPYSGDSQEEIDQNVAVASAWSQVFWKLGAAVICPHLNTQGFEKPGVMEPGSLEWREDFEMFLTGDFEFISRCDAVFFIPGWERSKGAVAEFAFAKYQGIPCFFDVEEMHTFIDEH